MKTLILLALLTLPAFAFAEEKPFMEFGDIKGEVTADVIDNAEESADGIKNESEVEKEARTFTVTNTGEEVASKAKELDKSSTNRSNRAQDYNSSRSNRRGIRVDTDDDDDSVPTRACNAKDNDCDDTESNKKR